MDIVQAVVPHKDGCPVLTRLAAFVIDQNVSCFLEHKLRKRDGTPRRLRISCPDSGSSLSSLSESSLSEPCEESNFHVRAKWSTWTVYEPSQPVDVNVNVVDPDKGLVRLLADSNLTKRPGLFRIEWGVFNDKNELVAVDHSLVSVEFNSFGGEIPDIRPPTIKELQMWVMDSAPNENFLLDDVEFTPDQILLALAWPIEFWNEVPPNVGRFSSANFPFRNIWMLGTVSKLYEMAAHHYRRNYLPTQGGGITVPDKAKEEPYLRESVRLRQEFESLLYAKKLEINLDRCHGVLFSPYL